MFLPKDTDYKQTKLIKQGRKNIVSPFKELSEWINYEFEVNVLNVYYDVLKLNKNKRPRLNVILEYRSDEAKFEIALYKYDEEKLKVILNKFKELSSSKYNTEDIFLVFSSFEPVAIIEANSIIPETHIDELKQKFSNPDLWIISRCFGNTTFFFYTDQQVKQANENGLIDKLTEEYFNLIKPYDEFNYIKKDKFSVFIDSKQNFDTNYKGSWFYYYS